MRDDDNFFSVFPTRTPTGAGYGLPLKGKSPSKMFKTPGRKVSPSGSVPKQPIPKSPGPKKSR